MTKRTGQDRTGHRRTYTDIYGHGETNFSETNFSETNLKFYPLFYNHNIIIFISLRLKVKQNFSKTKF